MKIETIKDLEALLKLLRKQGVEKISIDGITMELGSLPSKSPQGSESTSTVPVEGQLTDEQLLFWSSAEQVG